MTLLLTLLLLQAGDRSIVVVSPSELLQRRQEYQQAWREWEHSDPTLERDLLSSPPQLMLKRIDVAEAKRRVLSQAKARYHQSLRQRYDASLERLRRPAAQDPSPADLAGRDKDMLREIVTDYAAIDEELKQTETMNPARAALLEKQRAEIAGLQNLYLQRQQAFEKLELSGAKLAETQRQVQSAYHKLATTVRAQEDTLGKEAQLWEGFYASLRQQVKARLAAAPARSFAGVWVYTDLATEAMKGEYPDKSIFLRITEDGAGLKGVYHGEVLVHPGERLNAKVTLTFEGRTTGSRAVLTLLPPYPGEMEISWVDDNTIRLDKWQVEEAKIDRKAPKLDFIGASPNRRLVRQAVP